MCSRILQNGPISMFSPGERVLWCAVVCLRELLHLVWIERRQRMSNYYRSHLVHPQSWCCSCVTSPPNPHIWSAKWPPELRAALQRFDTPSLHPAFSSLITEDVKWGRSLLSSNRCFERSETALVCPRDIRKVLLQSQGRVVDCRDDRRRACIISGACGRKYSRSLLAVWLSLCPCILMFIILY